MSAVQYIDRRFDVLALQGAKPTGEVLLAQQLFGFDSGEVCTGIQKLAQRWALEFLTPRGTVKFLPRRGTDFMLIARRGGFRHEQDVRAEYNFAAVRIKQTLKNEEVAAMQDDERLSKDELLQLILGPQTLQLKVQLTSLAGSSREIILPIPMSPIKTG